MNPQCAPERGTRDRARRRKPLLGQSVWFVLVGAMCSALSALAYLLLRQCFPVEPANAISVAVSTIVSSEAHRKVTFAGERARRLAMHAQSVAVFAYYYAGNAVAIDSLHAVATDVGAGSESLALLAVSACAGLGRFAALRLWVFRPVRSRRAAARRRL